MRGQSGERLREQNRERPRERPRELTPEQTREQPRQQLRERPRELPRYQPRQQLQERPRYQTREQNREGPREQTRQQLQERLREQPREQTRHQPQQQPRQRGPALPAAVGALCRALPARARPAPDTLRRARFDRPQASLDFWRLLYVLLKQLHGGRWTESDAIGAQVSFVKSALWYHGYARPQLHGLPPDGSAGSRELLLAFSWLLHPLGLLQQLLAQSRVSTGDETSVCTCEDDLPTRQEGAAGAGPGAGLGGRVDVRYLQWLHGRLRLQWCSLHAQHQEQCKLLHKIHVFTSGSHMDQLLGHFSVTETDLIRHPESCKQLVQLLESETKQLEAFLEWKQLEPVYWQWMESVLDDVAEEGRMGEPQEERRLPGLPSCPWAARLTGQMDRLSGELVALQEHLQQLLAHRRAAWWDKVAAREDLQKEFCATAGKVQEGVELKLRGLTSLGAPKKTRIHGSCRLVLRSRGAASTLGCAQAVPSDAAAAASAAQVIRELQVRGASLQRELQQLQQQCQHRLQEIAQGLEGVICICP